MPLTLVTPRHVSEWFYNLRRESSCHELTTKPFFYQGELHQWCDESIVYKDGQGDIKSLATISMKGENDRGPTMLALYTLPEYRGRGYGTQVFEKAVLRLFERGAVRVLINLVSEDGLRRYNALPEAMRSKCQVLDMR